MGAVLVAGTAHGIGIVDGGVVVGEVVAVDIVDVAVAVIVELVARDLAGVGPQVVAKVRVVHVDALVDHGHHRVGAAGGRVPRLRRVDVGVGRPAGLAGVVEAIELVVGRVVGDRGRLQPEVRLGVGHQRRTLVPANGLGDAQASRQAHDVHGAVREILLERRVVLPVEQAQVRQTRLPLKGDDNLAGGVRPRAGLRIRGLLAPRFRLGQRLLRRTLKHYEQQKGGHGQPYAHTYPVPVRHYSRSSSHKPDASPAGRPVTSDCRIGTIVSPPEASEIYLKFIFVKPFYDRHRAHKTPET